ncbi:MAG: type II toxin-antitoxin system Phd/YefM family antitoxin [Rhizobiaceae bacterium]|nr:type II toxin-antitoxin system Phd/YefM family antitoxin [Rhizobiaceae bacterium]
MKTVQVREAKASLSALIEAAEAGSPTVITRHGKPAAAIVPVADIERLYPNERPNFGAFLLRFPGGIDFERRTDRMRDIDL